MEKLRTIYKWIRFYLLMNDWIWSVLLAFIAYQMINYGPPKIFNVMMAYFSINWIQPLFATAGVMAGLFAITRLGLYFNLRKKHRYIWGEKDKETGQTKYESFEDFKKLTSWQRHLSVSFWLVFFFVAALMVFLRFIPLAGPQ